MRSLILTAGLLLAATLPTLARDAPSSPQTQAFALGYSLRSCDLRSQAFAASVKTLQDVDDDKLAGAQVKHLSRRAINLRKHQAEAYARIAKLLERMDAPPALRHWSAQTAQSLAAPLAYSGEASALLKTEPDTAATLAELSEITAVKAQAGAMQPSLTNWLKLTGGRVALWNAEVGSYTADLGATGEPAARLGILSKTAQHLLLTAPEGASSEVRGDLSELVPGGGGNLSVLATLAPANLTPLKMTNIARKLISDYEAKTLIQSDKSGDAKGE